MYTWNDGLKPGGRTPKLYLAKGGEVVKFKGVNIPNFCAIAAQKYEAGGKWSNTTYRLELAPGVRAIYFLSPLHGTWGDDIENWGQACETLALPIEKVQRILREEYPRTAKRFDDLEAFVASTGVDTDVEVVLVSFGSPNARDVREGYWAKPKSSRASDGRTVTVRPVEGPYGPEWAKAEVVAPKGAKIISTRHSPGMKGGYWTIEVAVQ